MKKGKKGNLIRFPVEKVKKPSQKEKAQEHARWMKENTRLFYSVALTATIFMAALANDIFSLGNSSEMGSREIASVAGRSPDAVGPSVLQRNSDFERKVARRLASMSSREMASVGYRPSEEEEIRFGVLEGKYGMEYFADGGLKTVRLAQNHSAQLSPTYLSDREEFILKAKPLISMNFEKVVEMSREERGSEVIETYDLVSSEDQTLAEVQFSMDLKGRLHSIKVEPLNQ